MDADMRLERADSPMQVRPSGVRHTIVALTFLLGLVLYVDRAAISVLARPCGAI